MAGELARARGPVRAWNEFFFTPADPRPLALARIVVGVLLVWNWVWIGFDLNDTLKGLAWADPASAISLTPPGGWSIWFWVPDGLVGPVWWAGLVVFGAYTLGAWSRVMAWIAWILVVSTIRRAPVIIFGFDNVMAIWTFYLAVSGASGQAYSFDYWLRARRSGGVPPTVSANLGLRLIQLHLCLIYASAGLAKLQGTPWWDGTAVGMLLGNSEFRPFDLEFLAEHPTFLEFATHLTVGFELLYPILIWRIGLRPWILAVAALLHVGIALTMGLTEFAIAMLAGNLAFVRPAWLDAIERLVHRRSSGAGLQSEKAVAPDSSRRRIRKR